MASTAALLVSASCIPYQNVAAVLAILSIFIGLLVSILLYRDAVRATSQLPGTPQTVKGVVLALPIRILGATSLLIGASILTWVAYNLLIEGQPQFTGVGSIAQLALPVVLIVFGYRLFRRPMQGTEGDEAA